MNLREELNAIVPEYKSELYNYIVQKLKQSAKNGGKILILDSRYYDSNCIELLKIDGLDVKETFDQRDGNFITIKW